MPYRPACFFSVPLALLVVAACTPPSQLPPSQLPLAHGVTPGVGQSVRSAAQTAPAGAPTGSCWDTEITPAVIETVTRQEQIAPPTTDTNGQILQPARFRTVTRQEVVRPRSETWFETLCPADFSPDFVATLQRALAVRGYHQGAITGRLDQNTQAAILSYQRDEGLDSASLSLANARKLGLISVKR